jgi:hypothetical protein
MRFPFLCGLRPKQEFEIAEQAIAALVLLIRRRHRMVLVLDAPSAVDLAKADGQPKLEAAPVREGH